MVGLFYWIIFLFLLLLTYIIYTKLNSYNVSHVSREFFKNANKNDTHLSYNLTKNSSDIDNTFHVFKDVKKYIKAPKSDKIFDGQYSRQLLNPTNPILPHLYFSDENKTNSRIINVDIFKTKILDKIIENNQNISISKLDYTEPCNKYHITKT